MKSRKPYYAKENKMTQSRIIVPTHYDVEIKILFDPRNGATEMHVRNTGTVPVSMLKVAGLVSEHTAAIIKQLITGGLNLQKIDQTPGDNSSPNVGEVKPNAS